jgi:hypothetical protein
MSVIASGPRGWNHASVSHRFADSKPTSFDKQSRTVDCVLSMGSPVSRFFGTEILRISPEAVNLDRMKGGSIIPLLDSHQATGINNALGRFTKTWFERKALMGTIRFNETPNGDLAMGMVERGEIAGISVGYTTSEWEITDCNGRIIDPDVERVRWDEDGMTFTATRWSVHEGSLCSVPADMHSSIRSMAGTIGSGLDRALGGVARGDLDVRSRMLARQRMHERAQAVIGNAHHE